jgi:hypothetical protein
VRLIQTQTATGIEVVTEEILHRSGTTLVRRMRLALGESIQWHRDPCHHVKLTPGLDHVSRKVKTGIPA